MAISTHAKATPPLTSSLPQAGPWESPVEGKLQQDPYPAVTELGTEVGTGGLVAQSGD